MDKLALALPTFNVWRRFHNGASDFLTNDNLSIGVMVPCKPTPKRIKMALILQAKAKHSCSFCRSRDTVRVCCISNDEHFMIRHQCELHKGFGTWSNPDVAWGWD